MREPRTSAEDLQQRLRAEWIRDLEAAGYVVIAPGLERDLVTRLVDAANQERP